MKVAVIYNEPIPGRPDSEDVLDEVRLVVDALKVIGYDFKTLPIFNDRYPSSPLGEEVCFLLGQLKEYSPSVVFNLVESIGDKQRFYPVIPSLFEIAGYPYTGSPFDAILTTTDKTLTKAVLTAYGIPTPSWQQYYRKNTSHFNQIPDARKKITHILFQHNNFQISVSPPWIIKPAWEDASVGIDEGSVFNDKDLLIPKLSKIYSRYNGQPILIEEYIDGREFNVSLFEHLDRTVELLPIAEMVFTKWPEEKPKIVSYKAKWDKGSFEYNNTVRVFDPKNAPLDLIRDLALRCWGVFGLRGYARVDMRMDKKGRVFVIEVNTNPCIAPESGFIIAAKEAGYRVEDVIKGIVDVAKIDFCF
jgi:D-alanine-D-alanine ligase